MTLNRLLNLSILLRNNWRQFIGTLHFFLILHRTNPVLLFCSRSLFISKYGCMMKPQWLINGLDYSAELLYNVVNILTDKSDQFSFCNNRDGYVHNWTWIKMKWSEASMHEPVVVNDFFFDAMAAFITLLHICFPKWKQKCFNDVWSHCCNDESTSLRTGNASLSLEHNCCENNVLM